MRAARSVGGERGDVARHQRQHRSQVAPHSTRTLRCGPLAGCLVSNHKPIIKGDDHAIWRRIQLIPFEHVIPPKQRDKNLEAKLRAELPGILNWCLAGCKGWLKRGLRPPKIIIDAVKSYRDEMDIIKEWVNDRCSTGPAVEWRASEAYASYKIWAEQNGFHAMTSSAFGRKLQTRFTRVNRSDGRWYRGIANKIACLRPQDVKRQSPAKP